MMRRKDREIVDREVIESIICRAPICRLAMCEGGNPYLVPLCFGYDSGVLYFHSAQEGRKLEISRRNSAVCFEMDIDWEMTGKASGY